MQGGDRDKEAGWAERHRGAEREKGPGQGEGVGTCLALHGVVEASWLKRAGACTQGRRESSGVKRQSGHCRMGAVPRANQRDESRTGRPIRPRLPPVFCF